LAEKLCWAETEMEIEESLDELQMPQFSTQAEEKLYQENFHKHLNKWIYDYRQLQQHLKKIKLIELSKNNFYLIYHP